MFGMLAQVAQGGGGSMGQMLIPMALVFGLFYVMAIRPQQRKEKERQRMISELRAGERVLFAGGFIGTIVEVKGETFMVELAPKVAVEIARGSVSQVLKDGEAVAVEGASCCS